MRLRYRAVMREKYPMPGDKLDKAYAIEDVDGARTLYANWATTYDAEFSVGYGYIAPREIARLYRKLGGEGTVLDVGAGTGAIAENLGGLPADAIDLSPEMLEVARRKGLYRSYIAADVTKPLSIETGTYNGVVSAGTFTHGHVGAECLPELMRVAKPGAVFVCGTLPAIYDAKGFGSTLALLQAHGKIEPVRFYDIPIYEGVDHDHAEDRGLVMSFRTCG